MRGHWSKSHCCLLSHLYSYSYTESNCLSLSCVPLVITELSEFSLKIVIFTIYNHNYTLETLMYDCQACLVSESAVLLNVRQWCVLSCVNLSFLKLYCIRHCNTYPPDDMISVLAISSGLTPLWLPPFSVMRNWTWSHSSLLFRMSTSTSAPWRDAATACSTTSTSRTIYQKFLTPFTQQCSRID